VIAGPAVFKLFARACADTCPPLVRKKGAVRSNRDELAQRGLILACGEQSQSFLLERTRFPLCQTERAGSFLCQYGRWIKPHNRRSPLARIGLERLFGGLVTTGATIPTGLA
jgi:hypothetical protein